jgi:bisdemethoxycurcumin synthase
LGPTLWRQSSALVFKMVKMVSTAQATVPGTERFISCDYAAGGLVYNLVPQDVPVFVGNIIERCLASALEPLGIVDSGWNNLFWVVHPGSHVILNSYEKALGLEQEKLPCAPGVREHGPSVLFMLDNVVRRHREEDKIKGRAAPSGVS